jgi:hypothetical protein
MTRTRELAYWLGSRIRMEGLDEQKTFTIVAPIVDVMTTLPSLVPYSTGTGPGTVLQ